LSLRHHPSLLAPALQFVAIEANPTAAHAPAASAIRWLRHWITAGGGDVQKHRRHRGPQFPQTVAATSWAVRPWAAAHQEKPADFPPQTGRVVWRVFG